MKAKPFFFRLIAAGLISLGLSACDQYDELFRIDLPNILADNHCGTMNFHTETATERCGAQWDSFGFFYEEDQVAQIILGTDDDSAFDYTPTFKIWFDTRYLKAGKTLTLKEAGGSCSRFKPELDNGDNTYFRSGAASLKLEIVEFKGEQTDDILDDHSQWVFNWEIECPDLVMKHKGQDQIDLNRNPIPRSWARGSGDPYPPFTE